MADVFISYARADRLAAEQLATSLKGDHGYSIWWDAEMLSGTEFRHAIMRELEKAKAAIVIWSNDSINSRYVIDEAEIAYKSGKLLAAHVPSFDPSHIPVGFLGLHSDCIDARQRLVAALVGRGITPVVPMRILGGAAEQFLEARIDGAAVTRLEEIEHWKVLRDSTDPRRYRAFLKHFQDGSFTELAFERLAELEWARLPQNPTNKQSSWFGGHTVLGLQPSPDETALEAFSLEFQKTKEAALARDTMKALMLAREEAEWSRIKATSDPDNFKRHLEAFRNGKYSAEGNKLRDGLIRFNQEEEVAWRDIATSMDLSKVKEFRKKFTKGRYALSAADLEEEIEWHQVEDAKDLTKIKLFVTKYPKGRFLGAAKNAAERIAPGQSPSFAATPTHSAALSWAYNYRWLLTSFDGRIGRAAFWGGILLGGIVTIFFAFTGALIGSTLNGQDGAAAMALIVGVPINLFTSFAVLNKRWHDRGKSGWWNLIALIPYLGFVWLLIELGCLIGEKGENRFGPDPSAKV